MLKQIGHGQPRLPELWQNLLDCHERIRRFSQLALKLAGPAPANEAAEAAAAVHRYFTIALPQHATDEDESIAPRLAAAAPELLEPLQRMTAEHLPIHQTIADLGPLWLALAAEPERHTELAGRLRAPAAWLCELFTSHLEPEEELIFPVMMERLTPGAVAEILEEMRARRGHAASAR